MSTSKTIVLQKAFLFLTTERSFQKRWVSLSSIESALRLRYPFGDHYNFDKGVLSKSLGKLHPKIDSLQEKNGLGVYRCKMSGGYFFTIQDPMLAPPEMPTTYSNNSEWNKLCEVDEKLLAIYEKKLQSTEHRENNYDRHAKKKQKVLDDVDIFLANKNSTINTTLCTTNRHPPTQMAEEWRELDYWDSGEAIKLFNPTLGKSVKHRDRDKLLQNIIKDADKVETIIEDWNNDGTTKLTSKQERRLVTQCLYLRKAYEIAVQCMNAWTWKECCAEAIKSLRDCGINYVGNEETIRRWHIYFRKHETFPNPLGCSRKLLEPKVFDFSRK